MTDAAWGLITPVELEISIGSRQVHSGLVESKPTIREEKGTPCNQWGK